MTDFLSFHLKDAFVQEYATTPPPFGFRDAAGTALGELVYLRTYSRKKADGSKERWFETCRRVIEGMYSIQKDYAKDHVLPWNDNKAQQSAQEAYDLLFRMQWTPPGRGLWAMGTEVVNGKKDSTSLQNCAFISTMEMTQNDPSIPFAFMMNVSMLGVGVGYDARGADKMFKIRRPAYTDQTYVVPDSREGWVESTKIVINAFLAGGKLPYIDYSEIRPEGAPIRTFGGVAPGPVPLMRLHKKIEELFGKREGDFLGTVDINDLGNLIGVCVVSGNVRRSALIFLGDMDDTDFLNLKNPEVFPERNSYDPKSPGWGWMSNNSAIVEVGQDLNDATEGIVRNGEPGIVWLDMARAFGRLEDEPTGADRRVMGVNPCGEQFLESFEMCTLADIHLSKIETEYQLGRAIKYAFLYAKTVTLLPTQIPRTNEVMQRNRRIGLSMSGIADFLDSKGYQDLTTWMNAGYLCARNYDHIYSEWLGVRESVKVTTVKPSGTTGLLVGESPGVHWTPGGEYFVRAMRLGHEDPLVEELRSSGYKVEPASESPDTTVVAYFPIHSLAKRSEKEVSIFEKIHLAATVQRWWSDNGVSATVSFDVDTESRHVNSVLGMYAGQLKAISFLPMGNTVYLQQPYTTVDETEYRDMGDKLMGVDLDMLYRGAALDAIGEEGCTTDVCEVKGINETKKQATTNLL